MSYSPRDIHPSSTRLAYKTECNRLSNRLLGVIGCIPMGPDGGFATPARIAEVFEKESLDEKLKIVGSYFCFLATSKFNDNHRTALRLLAEGGLVRLLTRILVEFVRWDERECRTTVTKLVGWTLPVHVLHYLYLSIKNHIHSAPGLDAVLAEWSTYASDAFEAIVNDKKIWRFYAGLKIGSSSDARTTLDSLGYIASALFDVDMVALELTPRTVRAAVRLLAKLRQCVVINDPSMQATQLDIIHESGPTLFLALRSISEESEDAALDIPGLTDSSYRDFVQQIVTVASTSSLDMSSEFALLHFILQPDIATRGLAEAIEQLSVLSHIVTPLDGLLSSWMAHKPGKEEKELLQLARDKGDITDVPEFLLSFFDLILASSRKYRLPGCITQLVESNAFFLAERVVCNSSSPQNLSSAFHWVHTILLYSDQSSLEVATQQLRVIAARSRYTSSTQVDSTDFPATVRCWPVTTADALDGRSGGITCDVELVASPTYPSASASSDASSSGSRPDPPPLTHWERVYVACFASPNSVPRPVEITIPILSTAEVCAAAGCTSLSPPTKQCSRCKDRYYCGSKCQTSDWKARHKVQCNLA